MWEKIKNILSREGGKCIVVEDGQPTYVVMKLGDYEVAEVNRNVDYLKAGEAEKAEEEIDIREKEEVKVEDLPF
ncbi:hypothetical protein KKE13_03165 [Patescibacteria group bacterium]|nr:hypothetical protein [Patescibacteria group bacterium]